MEEKCTAQPLLEVCDLRVSCAGTAILRGVSLSLDRGEILGVVGESGCGKSTLLGALLGLLPGPDWQRTGTVRLEGRELSALSGEEMRRLRGEKVGAVFQNPGDSLNPSRRIKTQFYEAIRAHRSAGRREAQDMAMEAMDRLHLARGREILEAYPFQLSGGQQQRVAIALAMVLQPELLLADEPTSALDVTVQAQVVREFLGMRQRFGTAIVLVSHNMGVVSRAADQLAVLYAGRIVEYGEKERVLARPLHPYTRALLAAVPDFSGRLPRGLGGAPPAPGKQPGGCAFAPRCPLAAPRCLEQEPDLQMVESGHWCACERGRTDG